MTVVAKGHLVGPVVAESLVAVVARSPVVVVARGHVAVVAASPEVAIDRLCRPLWVR